MLGKSRPLKEVVVGERKKERKRSEDAVPPGEKDADRPETMPAKQLDPTTPPYPAPNPDDPEHKKPEFENPHLEKNSKR
jgi:hypothetical protein